MIKYKVVGYVGNESTPSYRWKDETSDYDEARQRLEDAIKYSPYTAYDIHGTVGPKPISWKIQTRIDKEGGETDDTYQ